MVQTGDNGSMLKGYMDTLSKVRTRFNVIKNQGDPGPGARQLMQQDARRQRLRTWPIR